MKNAYSDNERIENLLIKVQLAEPLPQLKERVTAEAKKAWTQAPLELPWLIPLRRLVLSAAAAVVIVWLANCFSDYALGRWGAVKIVAAVEESNDIEALPELPHGPFIGRLVSVGRPSFQIDASSLNRYMERVRQMLDEPRQNGTSAPIGRSRQAPDRSGANLYS